ncbi:MAG TPA: hypothetical protein VI306_22575 [Pyrinomonadaceae bacterium]
MRQRHPNTIGLSLLKDGAQRTGGICVHSLPFALADATAGTENELQAVVTGGRSTVDLPVTIERSKYFANIASRIAHGEAPARLRKELHEFLTNNKDQVWENSWVRFPRKSLSPLANGLLEEDLAGRNRSDAAGHKFVFETAFGDWVRIPISYLVKLCLVDVVGSKPELPREIIDTAFRLLPNFSNDLTSPETHSFHLIDSAKKPAFGHAIAAEMGTRFLLTHLLTEWANKIINLEAIGQSASVSLAPHPAVRQRELNGCVSDAFYRELFVSPCLSGWANGKEKHEYMLHAHEVTSRSQLNAAVKLREAGIITSNLIVVPTTSSVSLANNGTHLSLGSKLIAAQLKEPNVDFTPQDEKRLGDLVIKITEHFLPLFVGTYTAAPYRLSFSDFHPEIALGFLPHELDYSHLRMFWRHWKRKADVRVFGQPLTPYGPRWIDDLLGKVFRLHGDAITDFRLIDFPVAWLCTESSSALDGCMGNTELLKRDLESMGVSDHRLKLYLPIALRDFDSMGFSGFEGRHYSLFESMASDFAPAADLQRLITLIAYKYAFAGTYTHADIPDDPAAESERRLPFFCAAVDLPAFNINSKSKNMFLKRIAALTKNTRASRHRGHVRVPLKDYQSALLRLLVEDGSDCIEMLGLRSLIADLSDRLNHPGLTAHGKLLKGILNKVGKKKALQVNARDFNLAAEQFYREELKQKFLSEGLMFVRQALKRLTAFHRESARQLLGDLSASHFVNEIERSLLNDCLSQQNSVHSLP